MYLPPKTVEEMNSVHPEGTRHSALLKIALPLIGNGMAEEAVFIQLRSQFEPSVSDKEIRDVVSWCVRRGPTPSGFGQPPAARINGNGHANGYAKANGFPKAPAKPAKSPQKLVEELTEGQRPSAEEWSAKSPVALPSDPTEATIQLFEALYGENESVNLVKEFTLRDGKAQPQGGGRSRTRAKWVECFRRDGLPKSESGVWMRHNPCGPGSGRDNAVTDADILSHRFLMVESDALTVEEQLAIYSKLRLPISVLVASGGGSIHAWLKVDCAGDAEYRETAKRIYAVLGKFGFDAANKNPSRLSRLPGALRTIGAKGEGLQRLIYLDPNPPALDFEAFEAAAEPLESVILASTMEARMIEYMRKKDTPFTLPIFEAPTAFPNGYELEGFYMRPQEVTIWTGPTHHGKSSLLANVMIGALGKGQNIFVCSLEHQAEQIVMLLSQIGCGGRPNMGIIREFIQFFGPKLSFMDKVGEVDPSDLFKAMRAVHARFGVAHYFIDSLMRVSGLEENYVGQNDFVNGLQSVAKETGGHVHLVAHPRKIDETIRAKKADIRGSGLLTANADNVVSVRRNTEKQQMREDAKTPAELAALVELHDTEVGIEKQRASGWLGLIRLNYDLHSKSFSAFKKPKK